MATIRDLVSGLNSQYDEFIKTRIELTKKVAYYTEKVNDLNHEIENNNYGVVQGYKKLVELQQTQRLRRKYKNELVQANAAAKNIDNLAGKFSQALKEVMALDRYQDNFMGHKLVKIEVINVEEPNIELQQGLEKVVG